MLKDLGFGTTASADGNIRISTETTPDFLHFIGECPVRCFAYKWDLTRKE
jgi:hypothetical protein